MVGEDKAVGYAGDVERFAGVGHVGKNVSLQIDTKKQAKDVQVEGQRVSDE